LTVGNLSQRKEKWPRGKGAIRLASLRSLAVVVVMVVGMMMMVVMMMGRTHRLCAWNREGNRGDGGQCESKFSHENYSWAGFLSAQTMAKAPVRVKQIFMNGRSGLFRVSYSVLMRTKNDVGTRRLTTVANRLRKDQVLHALASRAGRLRSRSTQVDRSNLERRTAVNPYRSPSNKKTEVMKITTIVLATALAVSSGCALAAGARTSGTAVHGAAGTASGCSGVRAGVSPGVAPNTTTGMGTGTTTGAPATPGLNANGPCNGASSTTRGGAC
jgi:hypothetical protein